MISVWARGSLLAAAMLVFGPTLARAGDDTLRLNLPGGATAAAPGADASTRTLAMTQADQAETELVFHRFCGGCGFRGGCGFGGWCGWRGGCCFPRFCYGPRVCYAPPVYAYSYSVPAYYAAPPINYSTYAAPAYYGVRTGSVGVSVSLANRVVRLELPTLGVFRPRPVATTVPAYRPEILPTPAQSRPVMPYAPPAPGTTDQTFPYDGGPAAPVPLPPGTVPAPAPAAPASPLDRRASAPSRIVSGQSAGKYVYPAYGEKPRLEAAPTRPAANDDLARRVSR